MCTRGVPTTCSSKILEGWKPPYDATVVDQAGARPAPSSSARPTSTSSRWARAPRTRRSGRRATRTTRRGCPAGRAAAARRRSPPGSPRSALGQRHRRLDPPAGRAVRRRRGQADVRLRQPLRPRRLRQQPRPDRPVHHTVADAALLLDVDRRPRSRWTRRRSPIAHPSLVDARSTRASRACASGGSPTCPRAPTPTSSSGSEPAFDALRAAGADDRRRRGAGVHATASPPTTSSPRRRRQQQPGPLRRRALRPARRGRRHQRDVHGAPARPASATRSSGGSCSARTRCRRGYYDAYYGKALKVRRLIADDFDRGVPARRRAAHADLAERRLPVRREGRQPAGDVPVRHVHDPGQPVRPPGR